jgi:abortive infection bacteriophage resistance protein
LIIHQCLTNNCILSKKVKLYKEDSQHIKDHYLSKIFPKLAIIKKIYNGRNKWEYFFKELSLLIDKNENYINMNYLGFPEYWRYKLDKINPETDYRNL